MDLLERLNQTTQFLMLAHPDPGLWSGSAAGQYEAQLQALSAEVSILRSQLWL